MTGSVAIVVPAYNAAKTLSQTLESALCQDGVTEIVVVDDGSRDDTLAIARRFEPQARVFTGPNGGVSAARNRGFAETTAPWLIFLDSDDLLLPGTVAKRLEVALTTGADVIVTDWDDMADVDGTIGPRQVIDWPAMQRNAEIATATHVWATTAALMYRRSLVEAIGGFRADLPIIQDARLLFDAAYHNARFAHADHVGARYRVIDGSLSRRDPAGFWLDVLLNGRQIEAAWRAHGPLDQDRIKAVSACYSIAARGLLGAAHPAFFDAVEAQARLGERVPRLNRIALPIASMFGLRIASGLMHFTVRV